LIKKKAAELRLCRAFDRGMDKVSTVLAYAWDSRTQGPGSPGIFLWHHNPVLTCGNRVHNCFFPIDIDAVERVDRAPAGLPMIWHETDVFFDPDDEHGGIVPLGTTGDASAPRVMSAGLQLMNHQICRLAHRRTEPPCYARLSSADPCPIAVRAGGHLRMTRDGACPITPVAGEAHAGGRSPGRGPSVRRWDERRRGGCTIRRRGCVRCCGDAGAGVSPGGAGFAAPGYAVLVNGTEPADG
jgi:hypothetical protein